MGVQGTGVCKGELMASTEEVQSRAGTPRRQLWLPKILIARKVPDSVTGQGKQEELKSQTDFLVELVL